MRVSSHSVENNIRAKFFENTRYPNRIANVAEHKLRRTSEQQLLISFLTGYKPYSLWSKTIKLGAVKYIFVGITHFQWSLPPVTNTLLPLIFLFIADQSNDTCTLCKIIYGESLASLKATFPSTISFNFGRVRACSRHITYFKILCISTSEAEGTAIIIRSTILTTKAGDSLQTPKLQHTMNSGSQKLLIVINNS